MNAKNTLYIAEPIFSENLQKLDPDSSFPPIKKIGITTGHPEKREKELLGTLSPVKISIVSAWTGVDAKAIEATLHSLLDNLRIDGEYFWDGNETLVEAITYLMIRYHPDAKEIHIENAPDVKAASEAADTTGAKRIYSEVVPELVNLGIKYNITKNKEGVNFRMGKYKLHIGARTGERYTFTIWSKTKTTENALNDFEGSQELAIHGTDDSSRRARIPMAKLETIVAALKQFKKKS